MSPGLSLIILGLSGCWVLMLIIGGVEVVGDGGVLFASLWLSLSADNGLTAARFLVVGDLGWLSWFSSKAVAISPNL